MTKLIKKIKNFVETAMWRCTYKAMGVFLKSISCCVSQQHCGELTGKVSVCNWLKVITLTHASESAEPPGCFHGDSITEVVLHGNCGQSQHRKCDTSLIFLRSFWTGTATVPLREHMNVSLAGPEWSRAIKVKRVCCVLMGTCKHRDDWQSSGHSFKKHTLVSTSQMWALSIFGVLVVI